jgi:acid phosphatase
MMKTKRINFLYYPIYLVALFSIGLMSCSASEPLNNPTTSATLWVQNAAEYQALTTMVYRSAGDNLNTLLEIDAPTASLEQTDADFENLPPAIILDVDETVLDNSPFQARLIEKGETYSPQKWNRWVREEKADAIAGAVDFTKKAAQKGFTIFYLTNREAAVEEATYNNLQKMGFPLKEGVDVLLTKNEKSNWTSAKVNRRKHVAQNYRIVMLFGDNLNDFLPAKDISNEQRLALVEEYENRFGTQWYVLPNPVYGSWEQALYDFDDSLSPKEIKQAKLNKLNTKN